jgi:hypothetical protein
LLLFMAVRCHRRLLLLLLLALLLRCAQQLGGCLC